MPTTPVESRTRTQTLAWACPEFCGTIPHYRDMTEAERERAIARAQAWRPPHEHRVSCGQEVQRP